MLAEKRFRVPHSLVPPIGAERMNPVPFPLALRSVAPKEQSRHLRDPGNETPRHEGPAEPTVFVTLGQGSRKEFRRLRYWGNETPRRGGPNLRVSVFPPLAAKRRTDIGPRHQSSTLRRGLSLLEVLLSLSILGVSFFAIGELMRVGARSAEVARDHTIAQILAESIMSQVSAGLLPPDPISGAMVDDPMYQADWIYSIKIDQIDQQGLIAVSVIVQQEASRFARPVTFSVVRWMIDPTIVLATQTRA